MLPKINAKVEGLPKLAQLVERLEVLDGQIQRINYFVYKLSDFDDLGIQDSELQAIDTSIAEAERELQSLARRVAITLDSYSKKRQKWHEEHPILSFRDDLVP